MLHLVQPVATGQAIEAAHLALRHGNELMVGTFADLDEATGRIARELLLPGEALMESKLANALDGRGEAMRENPRTPLEPWPQSAARHHSLHEPRCALDTRCRRRERRWPIVPVRRILVGFQSASLHELHESLPDRMIEGKIHQDFWPVARAFRNVLPKRGPGGAALVVYHRGEKVIDV